MAMSRMRSPRRGGVMGELREEGVRHGTRGRIFPKMARRAARKAADSQRWRSSHVPSGHWTSAKCSMSACVHAFSAKQGNSSQVAQCASRIVRTTEARRNSNACPGGSAPTMPQEAWSMDCRCGMNSCPIHRWLKEAYRRACKLSHGVRRC